MMPDSEDDDEDSPGMQAGVRTKSLSSQSMHCNGCERDFSNEDDYLGHVYENDKSYNEYLALDRKEMGKE
jgi:hypothetical protein